MKELSVQKGGFLRVYNRTDESNRNRLTINDSFSSIMRVWMMRRNLIGLFGLLVTLSKSTGELCAFNIRLAGEFKFPDVGIYSD